MEAAFAVKAPTEKNPLLDSAPFTAYYLLGHSLELLLKSFLIGRGTEVSELRSRKYGHDLEKLLTESKRRKSYTPLLAILFTSGLLHAQTTIPAGPPGDPGDLTAPLTVEGDTTIEGNANVQGETLLNGTLTVQPAVGSTVVTTTTPGGGVPTELGEIIDNGDGPVKVNQTVLSNNTGVEEVTGGGGATIETNGNTNLSADSVTTTTVQYQRVVRFDVAQAGHTGPTPVGLPVPGTERYFMVDPDTGDAVSGPFSSEADLDAFIADPANSPAALFALNPDLGNEDTADGPGGNLTVEGQTTTNGINNSGEQINGVAVGLADDDAATVGQVNAADTAIQADVDQNELDSDAADAAIQADVDQNELDSDAADAAIQADVDQNELDSDAADAAIQAEIDAEEIARADADTAIRGEFAAADALLGDRIDTEIQERISGDVALGIRINDEESARIAADNALNQRVTQEVDRLDGRVNGVQIDLANETNNRIAADNALRAGIDENTRGIAMVAAMTNTRVEAGKTHGVDFNMAQFQSETGFAFGYANRVNENVQVHGSLASTTDLDESVVRVGVSVQW